jgi:hypothetical protein
MCKLFHPNILQDLFVHYRLWGKMWNLTYCDYKVGFEPNWKDEIEIMLWSAHQITLFMNSFSHCPID